MDLLTALAILILWSDLPRIYFWDYMLHIIFDIFGVWDCIMHWSANHRCMCKWKIPWNGHFYWPSQAHYPTKWWMAKMWYLVSHVSSCLNMPSSIGPGNIFYMINLFDSIGYLIMFCIDLKAIEISSFISPYLYRVGYFMIQRWLCIKRR